LNYYVNINKASSQSIPFTQTAARIRSSSRDNRRNYGALNYNALPLWSRRRMGQVTFDAHWTWTSNY